MQLSDVLNTDCKKEEFNSHTIGYIADGKEIGPVELSDWNDANRILYLGEEGRFSLSQNCLRILQGINSGESMVIFDEDGSLFKIFSDYPSTFKTDGYSVKRVDLSNPADSDGWNVLKTACTPADSKFYWAPRDRESAVSNFVKTASNYFGSIDKAKWYGAFEGDVLTGIVNCVLDEEYENLYGVNSLLKIHYKLQQGSSYPKYSSVPFLPGETLEVMYSDIQNCFHFSDTSLTKLLSKDGFDFSLPFRERCIFFVTIPEDNGIFFDYFCQELIKAGRMYLTDHVEPYGREREGAFPYPVHFLFNCSLPNHVYKVMERAFAEFFQYVNNLSVSFSLSSINEVPMDFAYCFRTIIFRNNIDLETAEFASRMLVNNADDEEVRYMRPKEIKSVLTSHYIAVVRDKGCFFLEPICLDEIFVENRG